MRSFVSRSSEPELMDSEMVAFDDFRACLADLSAVNTLTLARPPTLRWLDRATASLPSGSCFTLLDVGYGHGEMLRAIRSWADRRGFRPTLIGIDLNPWSAPSAAAATPQSYAIDYRTGDVFDFRSDEPIDFIISSLFTHHLPDEALLRFLRWMEATATRGWYVNDLHRHPIAFYGFALLARLAGWHRFVRHDGPISVARSFRRGDWLHLLRAAGIDPADVELRWHMPFRLCLGRLRSAP